MKIGLLGAPGSGKTLVAKKLQDVLNKDNQEGWKIVDGYVEKLSQRTGISFSEISTYAQNFAVMTDRWVREAEIQTQGYHSITCGTIYETIMYASFIGCFRSPDEGVMMYDTLFTEAMMTALGGFEQSTYSYDVIFFLPWTKKYAEAHDHTFGMVINAKLTEALDGFRKIAIPLTGSTASRAAQAAKVVRDIRTAQSPQAN